LPVDLSRTASSRPSTDIYQLQTQPQVLWIIEARNPPTPNDTGFSSAPVSV